MVWNLAHVFYWFESKRSFREELKTAITRAPFVRILCAKSGDINFEVSLTIITTAATTSHNIIIIRFVYNLLLLLFSYFVLFVINFKYVPITNLSLSQVTEEGSHVLPKYIWSWA